MVWSYFEHLDVYLHDFPLRTKTQQCDRSSGVWTRRWSKSCEHRGYRSKTMPYSHSANERWISEECTGLVFSVHFVLLSQVAERWWRKRARQAHEQLFGPCGYAVTESKVGKCDALPCCWRRFTTCFAFSWGRGYFLKLCLCGEKLFN